jgi:hypothetical protein
VVLGPATASPTNAAAAKVARQNQNHREVSTHSEVSARPPEGGVESVESHRLADCVDALPAGYWLGDAARSKIRCKPMTLRCDHTLLHVLVARQDEPRNADLGGKRSIITNIFRLILTNSSISAHAKSRRSSEAVSKFSIMRITPVRRVSRPVKGQGGAALEPARCGIRVTVGRSRGRGGDGHSAPQPCEIREAERGRLVRHRTKQRGRQVTGRPLPCSTAVSACRALVH